MVKLDPIDKPKRNRWSICISDLARRNVTRIADESNRTIGEVLEEAIEIVLGEHEAWLDFKKQEAKMPRTSNDRFSHAYGQKSVIFRNDNGRESNPFQPYDEKDVEAVRYYNTFTYNATNATYDVRVYTTGEIAYEKDTKPSEKLPHHTAIEKHFKEQIAETIAIFDKIPNL